MTCNSQYSVLQRRPAVVNRIYDYIDIVLIIITGHLQVIQWLIERGVDPTRPTTKGCTPLLSAAHAGNVEMLQYLSQFQTCAYAGAKD